MCATTSARPTTARLRESTVARTPARCIRGPAHPKNSRSGLRRRSASARPEAYKSPEASPAEIRTLRATLANSLSRRRGLSGRIGPRYAGFLRLTVFDSWVRFAIFVFAVASAEGNCRTTTHEEEPTSWRFLTRLASAELPDGARQKIAVCV